MGILYQREIPIVDPGAPQNVTSRVPISRAWCHRLKRRCIEPFVDRPIRQARVTNNVGAPVRIAGASRVGRVKDGEWKSGLKREDTVDLPTRERSLRDRAIGVKSWKLIQITQDKAVSRIKGGRAPV